MMSLTNTFAQIVKQLHARLSNGKKKGVLLPLCLSLVSLLIINNVHAQAVGDYRTSAAGTWENALNWQRYNGTAWVGATVSPSFVDGVITVQHNMSINSSKTLDQTILNVGSQIDVLSGTININDGAGADLTLNGTVFWNSTANLIVPAGALVNGSIGNFFYAGSDLSNNGTIDLVISMESTANTISGVGTIKSLTTRNNAGVTLLGDQTITTLLNFNFGNIITGANKIIYARTASPIQNNSGTDWYVNGNLQMNFNAGTSTKTYRVGDNNGFRPVDVTVFGSNASTGGVLVATKNPDHPNIATSAIIPTKSVNRYWDISNVGITPTSISANLSWVSGEIDGGANTAAFVVGAYDGTSWTSPSFSNPTSTSINTNVNLTQASSYQVGEPVCIPTNEYRSGATGDWSNASTWQTFNGCTWVAASQAPSATDAAITIRSGNIVTANTAITADQVTVDAGGTLSLVSTPPLTIADGAGTDLTVNGTLNLSLGTLDGAGSIVINSGATLNWNGGYLAGSGTTDILAGATVNVSYLYNVSHFQGPRTLNNASTNFTISTSDLIFDNNAVFNNTGTITIIDDHGFGWGSGTGGLLNNTGTIVKTAGTDSYVPSDTRLTFNNNGILKSSSGNIRVFTNGTHGGNFEAAGPGNAIRFGNGIQTFSSTATFTGAGTIYLEPGNLLTFDAGSSFATSVNVNEVTGIVNWNNTPTLGNFTLGDGTMQGSGTVSISGNFNWNDGRMEGSGTTTILNGATASFAPGSFTNLDMTGPRTINNLGTLTLSKSLGFESGASLNNSGTINITGDYSLFASNGNGSTISNSGTITKSGGAGTSQLGSGSNLVFVNTSEGNVNVNSGTISISSDVTHDGNYSIAPGATLSSAGFLIFTGNTITNNGTINIPTFVFEGSADQNINGTGSIQNLAINSPHDINLGGDQTISNSLTLTSGKINTGSNKLIVNEAASLTISGTSWVNGTLERVFPTGDNTLIYPVGDDTRYTPVSTTTFGATAPIPMSIASIPTDEPFIASSGIDPIKSVNRYWTVKYGGALGYSTQNFTFNWAASGDLDGGLSTTANLIAKRYDLDFSIWSPLTSDPAQPTSITVTGVPEGQAMWDYQVGEASTPPPLEYHSITSGDWNTPSTWETFDGVTTSPATIAPDANSQNILIRSGDLVTLTGATITLDQVHVQNGGTLSLTNSTINYFSELDNDFITAENGGTLNINGSTISANGGTTSVELNAGSQSIITNGLTIGDGVTLQSAGDLQINTGAITFQNNSNFNNSGYAIIASDIQLNGNAGINNTGSIDFNDDHSITDAGASTISNQVGAVISVYGVWSITPIINNGGLLSVTKQGTNNAQLTISNPANVYGGNIGNYGGEITGTQPINFIGTNINNNGIITVPEVIMSGSALQSITTSGSGGTINNLTIDNGSGVSIYGDGNQRIGNALSLNNGVVTTDNFGLTLKETASATSTGNSWVNGSIIQNVATGGSGNYDFYVGDATYYTPVSISLNNVTTGGSLSVASIPGANSGVGASGLDPTKTLGRYYAINNSGIQFDNAGLTLNWNSNDVNEATTTAANFIVAKVDGETWTKPAFTNLDATSVQINNVTSFSDWLVGEPAVETCTVNIPDANFKNALINNPAINLNDNLEIECSEAAAYTGTIDVSSLGITDLTGIEAFTSITGLNVASNNLSTVNLSANTALTTLNLGGNQLGSVDVSTLVN
ncbi:MAG: hypothetical protein ABI402_13665, partial [Ferruginibacter sp.]